MPKVSIYCWHHLTGYITQLEVWRDDLRAIEEVTRFAVDITRTGPPRAINMKRLRTLDLKDASQRIVRFFHFDCSDSTHQSKKAWW